MENNISNNKNCCKTEDNRLGCNTDIDSDRYTIQSKQSLISHESQLCYSAIAEDDAIKFLKYIESLWEHLKQVYNDSKNIEVHGLCEEKGLCLMANAIFFTLGHSPYIATKVFKWDTTTDVRESKNRVYILGVLQNYRDLTESDNEKSQKMISVLSTYVRGAEVGDVRKVVTSLVNIIEKFDSSDYCVEHIKEQCCIVQKELRKNYGAIYAHA